MSVSLAVLWDRYLAYADRQDAEPVLDAQTRRDVKELLDAPMSVAEIFTVASVCWLRLQLLPPDRRQWDVTVALSAFASLAENDGDLVPRELVAWLNEMDGPHAVELDRLRALPPSADATPLQHAMIGEILLHDAVHDADQAALVRSAKHLTDAAMGVSPGHPAASAVHANAALAYATLYERYGAAGDGDAALGAARLAVEAAVTGEDQFIGRLRLGLVQQLRYDRTGHPADLAEAVEANLLALRAVPEGHPARGGLLSNLSVMTRLWFELDGQRDRLDQAISFGRAGAREAVGTADEPGALSNCGLALRLAFNVTQADEYLEEAIDRFRRVLEIAPLSTNLAGWTSNLCTSLIVRFQRHNEQADIEEAVSTARRALEASRPGHLHHAAILANLAGALASAGEDALDEAITISRKAIEAAADDSGHLVHTTSQLGTLVLRRFERCGHRADIEEAVAALSATLHQGVPHDLRVQVMDRLAQAHIHRFPVTGDPAELSTAAELWSGVAEDLAAPTRQRLAAARGWANIAYLAGQPTAVAYTLAVDLLPRLAWRGLTREQREYQLEAGAGLAGEAAAALLPGDPGEALRRAEAGRAVLWSQTLETRTDLAALRARSPEVADRVAALMAALG
ncbi:hypothetical protein [Actinoplanes lobatus]|nr:hypothetical protein [Actinoplanes lobatus]MBB4749970.1 tetratricopeptide (TPR) repeat protein [Actinoplanes lobatus]